MKTIKLIFTTGLIIISSIGFAQWDEPNTQNIPTICTDVFIKLNDAIQNRGLLMEMQRQVKPDILKQDRLVYLARVSYKGNVYCIKGSYDDWKRFFKTILSPRLMNN